MEEFIVLQSRRTVPSDNIVIPDDIPFHGIEDEEDCNNEGPKPKRKASAERFDKLKKAKLDHVGHIKMKAKYVARVYCHYENFTHIFRDQYQADEGNNHKTSDIQDSSKGKDSVKIGVPEPQENTSEITGRSRYRSLNVQEPSKGRGSAVASVTEPSDDKNTRCDPALITTPFTKPPSNRLRQQSTTRASLAASKSRSSSTESSINSPASSNSSLNDNTVDRRNREAANRINLIRVVEDAKNKLDHPAWGVIRSLGVDLACVTKEVLDQFKSPACYSIEVVLAWRASLSIPSNWAILVQDEVLSRHPISDDITDIVQIYLEENRHHFTTTHFSIQKWTVVYYDSYIWKFHRDTNQDHMFRSCDRLGREVRYIFSVLGFEIPDRDPLMSAKVSGNDPSL